ncbi:MAG: sigma-54-dependent Fis family transcriptional regulator [Deltaproteobacteria bacterium]|nr:sigma-54-dependent Fis family transcriptional regulator [Deltaproteobacteria bacterium]MBW2015606.1 sigma-54-dependent Fis family transcriptional regulator [Deltaproteobacteria bacterium]MBW2128104.1 sigma-54-dependent Fis family transcriptional regulator [Deltaproteobacteria bacterium]MBW2303015.1 sigma-54-dependent Fis family transcriptional regulator [Deltaproteobacteria bacterium]
MAKVLLVDDEDSILESLEMFLSEKGHEVYKASCGGDGIEIFSRVVPDVVILDIRLPDMDGIEVLNRLQGKGAPAKVIMMTAFHDMETTVQAMKGGAYDYIHKPLDVDEIEKSVNRALHLLEVDRKTPSPGGERAADDEVIIGKSEKMREIFKMIGLLCRNRATVLIQGETGTGKELIARAIHKNSSFADQPFVTLDCAAAVETLLESELFGHESGAFTGANRLKKGKIELAGSGTLFLDEVGELPPYLQGKFLGFLQRKEYMRIGGQQALRSKCRIIAATNKDLAERVRRGDFREDLFFRLRVVTIQVPPLRDRLEDIPALADHFLQKIGKELGTGVCKLQKGTVERLMRHPWNGNVRELENVLVEAVVKAHGKVILVEEIERILQLNHNLPASGLASFSLLNVEKEHIENTLRRMGWNRTRAARALGISLPTLRSKIRKYGIEPPLVSSSPLKGNMTS